MGNNWDGKERRRDPDVREYSKLGSLLLAEVDSHKRREIIARRLELAKKIAWEFHGAKKRHE